MWYPNNIETLLSKRPLNIIKLFLWAQEKASVTTERNGAKSVRRQIEHSEMKLVLLRVVPKVTERKEYSECVRKNDRIEVTEGTGTINQEY